MLLTWLFAVNNHPTWNLKALHQVSNSLYIYITESALSLLSIAFVMYFTIILPLINIFQHFIDNNSNSQRGLQQRIHFNLRHSPPGTNGQSVLKCINKQTHNTDSLGYLDFNLVIKTPMSRQYLHRMITLHVSSLSNLSDLGLVFLPTFLHLACH